MEQRAWTQFESQRILELSKRGMTYREIAQVVGRTPAAVEGRLVLLRKQERMRKEEKENGPRDRYIIKKTNFERGRVEVYKEILFSEHGGYSKAWDFAMRLIHNANIAASRKKEVTEFYWLKYK